MIEVSTGRQERNIMEEHGERQSVSVRVTQYSIPQEDTGTAAGAVVAKSEGNAVLKEDSDEHPELLDSNAVMRQQPQDLTFSEGGPVHSSCGSSSSVSTSCTLRRKMQTPSRSLATHRYAADRLSAAPMGLVHPQARQSKVNLPGSDQSNSMPIQVPETAEEARLKAKIINHPMFSQMLNAHIGCVRTSTPVDQLRMIDEQLAQSQETIDRYSIFAPHEGDLDDEDKDELDYFMRNYTMILMNMQDQLQNHMRVHATEAMKDCWELEQKLYRLTGAKPGVGNGAARMSDDEDEEEVEAAESEGGEYETGWDINEDSCTVGSFLGPLFRTETERSLMECARQELKRELSEQGYREKLIEVREGILRRESAGK